MPLGCVLSGILAEPFTSWKSGEGRAAPSTGDLDRAEPGRHWLSHLLTALPEQRKPCVAA